MTFTLNIIADPPKITQRKSPISDKKNSKNARKRKRAQNVVEAPNPTAPTPSNDTTTTTPTKKDVRAGKFSPKKPTLKQSQPSSTAPSSSSAPSKDDLERTQRAAYMAEFHARPLELDRRAGVTTSRPKPVVHPKKTDDEHCPWTDLPLHARLISALHKTLGPTSVPTPIQCQAIPLILQQQNEKGDILPANVFIHSATGSGKTFAYLLPMLQSLMASGPCPRLEFGTRALVLCPTRELATQTTATCEPFLRAAGLMHILSGALGSDDRAAEKVRLRKGLGLVVATPGRFLDHLTRTEALQKHIGQLQWIILDEVDRLFDAGLGPQVQTILQKLCEVVPAHTRRPWRSVCVSATVTEHVQGQVKDMFAQIGEGGKQPASWVVVKSRTSSSTQRQDYLVDSSSSKTPECLSESSPPQLVQSHVTCSAKLRLTALLAFLLERVTRSETTVVFVSTCAAVDFYHALFTAMPCILPSSSPEHAAVAGIFGKQCSIFKLHGQVPPAERTQVVQQFRRAANSRVLLTTDVAARGLNLPAVDWIVQYDPPGDVADYVHRAGRVARAGGTGNSLLFVLPAEKDFVSVLQHRGVHMSAMALTGILNTAARLNQSLTEQGVVRSGGTNRAGKDANSSRSGEAFCLELQHRLEECVLDDDRNAKVAAKSSKRSKASKPPVSGQLIELARNAFLAHVRAYPTKEKAIRHIFSAKALHLGHVARSFALKEPPKKLVAASQSIRKRTADALAISEDVVPNKKSSLSFTKPQDAIPGKRNVRKRKSPDTTAMDDRSAPVHNPGRGRILLMANAAKLQSNGLDAL